MADDRIPPRVAKWPFFLGDALLIGCAWFIYRQATLPLNPWELGSIVACVAVGAWLMVKPFLLEYQATTRLVEAQGLAEAVAKLERLDAVAAQIAAATAQWQGVQDVAAKTTVMADELSRRMGAEANAFKEFLQKANDSERAALRLEVEKARRAEGDWLQVLVRVIDHVLAVHGAAVRSGQPQITKQLTQFRDACLDATRRVGLAPYGAAPGQPFDRTAHQRLDEQAETAADAKVAEALAPGYTYQGKPLRRALVRLEGEPLPQTPFAEPAPERQRVEASAVAVESSPKTGELL